MRTLNLPALPAGAVSGEDWEDVYWERYRACRIPWPRVSVVLMAYLAWPNDEERRNTFIATCLALFSAALAEEALPHSEELASFGGVAAIAKPHSFRCWVKLRIWNVNGLRWRRYFN